MTALNIFEFFDSLGVLVFALSGALSAYRLRKDIYVIFIMAGCVGMGGGLLRDLVLQRTPIFLIEIHYLFIVIFASLAVFFAAPFLERHWARNLFIYLDAFGLGIFVVIGIQAGLDRTFNWHGSLFLGMLTAIAGGTLRDLLLGQTPVILTDEVYATPPLLGGLLYLLLDSWQPRFLSLSDPTANFLLHAFSASVFTALLRITSFHMDWHLPVPLQQHDQHKIHKTKEEPNHELGPFS